MPAFLKVYGLIILTYVCCALIYAFTILEWDMGKFSIFFAAKYLQVLFVLYLVAKIPLDEKSKEILHSLLILIGVFTAVYCIPEYLNPIHTVEIMPGEYVTVESGILVGPFSGAAYFSLALYSPLYSVLALSRLCETRRITSAIFFLCLAMFIAWPAMFSGSRSGVAYIAMSSLFLFLFSLILSRTNSSIIKRLLYVVVGLIAIGGVVYLSFGVQNKTAERITKFEKTRNSTASRLGIFKDFGNYKYKYEDFLPFIGAGFGVAPIVESTGKDRYRVGYGFHNAFLANYEQGGVLPCVLFLVFLWMCLKSLIRSAKAKNVSRASFATAILAYFMASLLVSLVGVAPWFGTDGAFFVSLILIAARRESQDDHSDTSTNGLTSREQLSESPLQVSVWLSHLRHVTLSVPV
jgi:hypothetical protein